MSKKSVSASILVLFLALVFAVIGACFSSFVYIDKKIKFEEIKLVSVSGVSIFEDKEYAKPTSRLKLSDMELGLKPATGEVDAETKIPSTITDEGTSEGYYETIYVKSIMPYKIVINNIKIENQKDAEKANAERENIFVAIKDVVDSTKSFETDEIIVAEMGENYAEREFTFLFWLSSFSGEELVGSTITFTIEFKTI